jgi:hypothetical protein
LRCEEKYSLAGGANVGSAKHPTGTPKIPGKASQRRNTVLPHRAQNDDSIHRPEAAVRRQLRCSPSIATTADSEKNEVYVNALPESFWHAEQLHAWTLWGAALSVTVRLPQLHEAVREIGSRRSLSMVMSKILFAVTASVVSNYQFDRVQKSLIDAAAERICRI